MVNASSKDAFQLLGENLHLGACASLRSKNPAFADGFLALSQSEDMSAAIAGAVPLLRGDEVKEWIPLLEAYWELDWRRRKTEYAVRMFCQPPPDPVLTEYGLSLGAWMFYHLELWVVTLFSLVECAEKLTKGILRQVVRKKDQDWKNHEKRIMDTWLQPLKNAVKAARDEVAHTHGTGVEGITEDGLWEPYLLGPPQDLLELRNSSIVSYHQRWSDFVTNGSMEAIRVILAVSVELDRLAFGVNDS